MSEPSRLKHAPNVVTSFAGRPGGGATAANLTHLPDRADHRGNVLAGNDLPDVGSLVTINRSVPHEEGAELPRVCLPLTRTRSTTDRPRSTRLFDLGRRGNR